MMRNWTKLQLNKETQDSYAWLAGMRWMYFARIKQTEDYWKKCWTHMHDKDALWLCCILEQQTEGYKIKKCPPRQNTVIYVTQT